MFQPYIDRLTSFIATPEFEPYVVDAKVLYFRATGEVFEEDEAYEIRMASFFEFFLLDYVLPGFNLTPLQLFLQRQGSGLGSEETSLFRRLLSTRHGLFEIARLRAQTIAITDLFTGEKLEVFERRKPLGISGGDILEARLMSAADEQWMFSTAFVFHPRDARKVILKLIKHHKKAGLKPLDLIWRLAYLRLRLDRYKHVRADAIYGS